jgi:valyl-tRNA synthetase
MVEGSDEFIPVATTRPETMFADVCVAVNAEDERYKHLIGKNVLIPASKRPIPVIVDEHADMELGTGAVKITPAHDPNDFEVSERHNLERPFCLDKTAHVNEMGGKYQGMERFECRQALVKDLEEEGLVVSIEKRQNSVGYSERTDVMVEPYLSKQWFVKMDNLAKDSLDFQQSDDKINFIPERFEKIFSNWMEGVYDWCISRQLWWGHRIPAWYRGEEVYVGKEAPEGEGWIQDNDVLDTWFSSALWPFSTLGWPEETEDFKRYFPTNFLESGYDIIFFWIARMIFQSLYLTGEKPFKDVMIHGLIRDEQGRKMSKSLGNGVDPIIEIEKYGTDALRYFLLTSSAPGQDLRYIDEKVSSTWNFINKIWNSSRFTLMNLGEFSYEDIQLKNLNLPDRWILTRLDEVIEEVNYNMDKYEFGIVGNTLYSFIWDDFCSWYIEMTKMTLQGTETEVNASKSTLSYVLLSIVKLLHPFMPFVTEEIYQAIPHQEESVCITSWPEIQNINDQKAKATMNSLIEIIRSVRTIRQDVNVAMSKPIDLMIKCDHEEVVEVLKENTDYLQKFCNVESLEIATDIQGSSDAKSDLFDRGQIFIPMANLINIEEEIEKFEKEQKRLQGEVKRCEGMLANERFTLKAPADKVQAERDKLEMYKTQLEAVKESLKELVK